MATRNKTKLLLSRNKLAITSPRKFLLRSQEAKIEREDNTLIIHPKKLTWQSLTDSLAMFTDDFMDESRRQPSTQKRTRFVATR